MDLPYIDISIFAKIAGAVLVTLPIAWNREKAQRTAGLRTFPIVSATSCGFLLTGSFELGDSLENARLMQGLIGGLGFLGGGAILKDGDTVKGMATAATIWSAGAIGMAAAYGRWEVAITLSLINFLLLTFGTSLKESIDHDGEENDNRPPSD